MKFSKVFLTAVLAGLSLLAAAAELTFDLEILRNGEADSASKGATQTRKQTRRGQKKTIAVFVIDCSGSMRSEYKDENERMYYGKTGKGRPWKRYEVIRDRKLPERFAALPLGTHVYAYLHCLRGDDWGIFREAALTSPEKKAEFLAELQREITVRMPRPGVAGGATPYYDTLAFALERIQSSGWLRDPNVYLELFDWSDGKNNTGGWTRFRKKTGEWAEFKYKAVQGRAYYDAQLREATALFEHDWGDVLKQVKAKKAEGKAFYDIQNVGSKKESDVKQISEYGVEFACDKKALENLQERIGLFASFPLDEDNWKLLLKQKGQWGVKVQFDSGQGRVYEISPGKSAPLKVTLPDSKGKMTKVTVSFVCPKAVPGEFTLFLPKPVEFYLSAPAAKATIERVEVQNTTFGNGDVRTVLAKDENGKSEKVFFMAEGSAKEYVWHFDDNVVLRSANGEPVSRTFGKIRDCKFSAFPKDNQESKIEGTIKVVATGIELEQPKGSLLTGKKVSFEAKVPRGNLKPSSCVWYVMGPLGEAKSNVAVGGGAGKAPGNKGNAGTDGSEARATRDQKSYSVRLDSKTLGSSHVFEEPGKYEVKVTACYDGLDQTREQLRQLVVKEPLAIEFSGMEPNGSNLDFRKQVMLKIKATKGAIKSGSVVWKANGNEIRAARGRKECMYPPEGEPKREKVTFSVEAEDAAVPGRKVTPEPATITYNLDCDHPDKLEVGSFRVGEKTASGAFRLYDKVEFRLTKGKYKDIIWTFGDDGKTGKPDAGQQSVVHVMSKAGKFPHTVVCKCAKCDKDFKGSLETDTESKEPKPVLSLKPAKTSYVKGDKVLLCDTGTGDYFKCRLLKWNPEKGDYDVYKDGLDPHFEVEISLGGEEFPVPVGRNEGRSQGPQRLRPSGDSPLRRLQQRLGRIDFKFKLQALDREGKNVLKEAERTVRVRDKWRAGLILAGLFILLVGLFWLTFKLLWGQEPSGWTLKYFSSSAKPDPEKLYDEHKKLSSRHATKILLKKYWKMWRHQAVIPLTKLGVDGTKNNLIIIPNRSVEGGGPFEIPLEFVCRPGGGDPPIEYGAIYCTQRESSNDDEGVKITYLRLLLDMSNSEHCWTVLFVIIWLLVALAFIGTGVWLFDGF